MNREQIFNILAEAGVDTSLQKGIVSNLIAAFNDDKKNAVLEAKQQVAEEYKEWKSPDEFKALQDEFTAHKESSAKAARNAKYKESKIREKYYDLADSKLKDSKDFDKDLQAWIKENSELLEATTQAPSKSGVSFSNLGNSGSEVDASSNAKMNSFIRGN